MAIVHNDIYQGDCREVMQQIEYGSVDLVFADPPFNIGYGYDVYDDDRSCADYLEWSASWMTAVGNVLKPSGSFWLAIGDEYAAELKLIAQNQAGFCCRSWVIWYYTFGVNCKLGFSRSHTHLFHFVKHPKQFTFNASNPAVRVLSARQMVYADARANGKGRLPDNTWILRPQDAPPPSFDSSHDTWYFPRVAGTFKEREGFHGCQMPEQLLARIIRVSSNPNDVVMDPFAGSGTTLAVAKKLGRQWLGIELSSDYVAKIRQRVENCRSGDPLVGAEDPLKSAPTTSVAKKKPRLRNGRPVLPLDAVTERGIIDAFESASLGFSADVILCDPERNAEFVEQCRRSRLVGDASTWNRWLLRIRKSGKLPRSKRFPSRLGGVEMDEYSAAVEIAMQSVTVDFERTLDDIFCSPELAGEFDRFAADFAPGFTPFQYRWAAMTLRKRAKSSRRIARLQFADWTTHELPALESPAKFATSEHECGGVYVLYSGPLPLYVGETLNIKRRVEQVLGNPAWLRFSPDGIRVISGTDQQGQHGLQAALVTHLNPSLNFRFLRPKQKPVDLQSAI